MAASGACVVANEVDQRTSQCECGVYLLPEPWRKPTKTDPLPIKNEAQEVFRLTCLGLGGLEEEQDNEQSPRREGLV